MQFLDLAYTKPYLMTLRPHREMDIALLGRPAIRHALVEYGPTPALGRTLQGERYDIRGLRTPARDDGYDPVPENNPELPVIQFVFHLTGLTPGQRVFYRAVLEDGEGRRATGDVYDFRAAPEAGQPFAFALMSDLQLFKPCDHTIHQLGAHRLDFILYAGDMINAAWHAGDWFTVPGAWQRESMIGMSFFDIMQRDDSGIRLMQYLPVFPCPGNHETDDNRAEGNREWALDPDRYSWRIYMQIFRTYYPDQQYGWNGKHWYSLDYAAMHLCSLMVVRCNPWNPFEAPGTILRGGAPGPDSRQGQWLAEDLRASKARFKWVLMHWHMMNRGDDTQPLLCQPQPDPADPARVIYPIDNAGGFLHPLFVETGVCGVNYGHSHVYERYLIDGVHYIEAAYMGVKYGRPDGPVNPSGVLPVNQQHDFRSYMIVSCDGEHLRARAYQASVEPNGYGYEGRVFDEFDIR